MAGTDLYLTLDIPRPLADLVHACEVHCVAGCCGTDAFDVSAAHMIPWVRENGTAAAQKALAQLDFLITLGTNSRSQVYSDEIGFGALWTPGEAVAYLETWRAEILRAVAPAAPPQG